MKFSFFSDAGKKAKILTKQGKVALVGAGPYNPSVKVLDDELKHAREYLAERGRVLHKAKFFGDFKAAAVDLVVQIKTTQVYKDIQSALTDSVESQFLEKPDPIMLCEGYPGDPVYFVNGIMNSRADAIKSGKHLACILGRPVHVIHNPSSVYPKDTGGVVNTGTPLFILDPLGDFRECVYDRLWPIELGLMFAAATSLIDLTKGAPFLQLNPTTRQVAHLLYHAATPISIVSHSQGCIIVRNACFTLALLGKADWIGKQLAWHAVASPLGEPEMTLAAKPAIFNSPTIPNDPISYLFAPMGPPYPPLGVTDDLAALRFTAHYFVDSYLKENTVRSEHVWQQTLASASGARSLSMQQVVTKLLPTLLPKAGFPLSVRGSIVPLSCERPGAHSLKRSLQSIQCRHGSHPEISYE